VHPLALGAEDAEEVLRLSVGPTDPGRGPGVELGGLARREHHVMASEDEPDPAAEDVEPLVAENSVASLIEVH